MSQYSRVTFIGTVSFSDGRELCLHVAEVFHGDLLCPSLPFTPAHMQVFLDDSQLDEHGDARVVYLYKLRPGLELKSHATQCEKLCGLPQPIIDRAAYVARMSRSHELDKLARHIRVEWDWATNSADRGSAEVKSEC